MGLIIFYPKNIKRKQKKTPESTNILEGIRVFSGELIEFTPDQIKGLETNEEIYIKSFANFVVSIAMKITLN